MSIYGIILGFICKLDIIEDQVLKRCTFSINDKKFVKLSFSLMNIGCVIYMLIAGAILLLKNLGYYFFLSGLFMLIFSALGPIIGKSNLNYLLSIYGEVLMILFLYLFFKKKKEETLNNKQIEMIAE